MQDIFADGIGNINVTGNIVRFDFVTLQPQLKGDNGEPVFATTQRIVMPIEGFLKGAELHRKVLQHLVDNGILKVNAAPEVAAAKDVSKE